MRNSNGNLKCNSKETEKEHEKYLNRKIFETRTLLKHFSRPIVFSKDVDCIMFLHTLESQRIQTIITHSVQGDEYVD